MNFDTVLNADMATVRAWLLSGFRWWTAELAAMVPARWKPSRRREGAVALFDGNGKIDVFRNGLRTTAPVPSDARMDLLVPDHLCLMRTQIVPRLGSDDIRRIIAFESERLMPLPAAEALIDYDREPGVAENGGLNVRVAMLPRIVADEALAATARAGIRPTRVGVATAAGGRGARFDFAPQLREEGRLASRPPARAIWWMLVAAAVAVNLILLVARDRQGVAQLAEMAEQQAPAVATARTISNRVRQFEINSAQLVGRRANHDALGTLAAVSAALPAGAWVQRYAWNGRTLRLTGYRLRDVDVVAALRKDPAFARVRATNSDVIAEIPAGLPFDVTIVLKGGRS